MTESISETYLSIYCNEEIIAINQDAKFAPSICVFRNDAGSSMLHIYEKELEDGKIAYALFNLGEATEDVKISFGEKATVRDVWAKEDVASTSEFSVSVPAHTVRIFKCSSRATTFSAN